jgi:hypothetical protein
MIEARLTEISELSGGLKEVVSRGGGVVVWVRHFVACC